ncbi:MAG: undecaprenyl-diphosphate phosphatase [Clostridia bacterium]|nr:undecaprenyl-diphosphate phosphatase [Clostridia bacterium]
MEIWQAIILGLVQGLTEFLPVSSSGHVAFFQGVFGINDDQIALFFTIILHLGTLVAVCVVFWKDIIALFKKPFKTLGFLALATVPAAITGLLFEYFDLDDVLLNRKCMGIVLSVLFFVTAAVLFITEMVVKRRQNTLPLCFKTVIPMGLAQAMAVLPGISRSGSTICAGTLAGCRSEEVAKFSFLMSIPVILGGFIVELGSGLYKGEIQQSFVEGGATLGWSVALGFIISAISGLFAIKVMLKVIKKANYKWFSLYLVLLSITCLVLHFTFFNA